MARPKQIKLTDLELEIDKNGTLRVRIDPKTMLVISFVDLTMAQMLAAKEALKNVKVPEEVQSAALAALSPPPKKQPGRPAGSKDKTPRKKRA